MSERGCSLYESITRIRDVRGSGMDADGKGTGLRNN